MCTLTVLADYKDCIKTLGNGCPFNDSLALPKFERMRRAKHLAWLTEIDRRLMKRKRMARAASRRRKWCEQHGCIIRRWDTSFVFPPPSPPPLPPSPPPPMPIPVEEKRLSTAVGARDLLNFTAMFSPPLEPLSSLPKLEASLDNLSMGHAGNDK